MASGRAFARAALAGNPSDGYGGAVLAVCVPELVAHAEARSRRRTRVSDPPSDARRRRRRALRARPVRGALDDDGPARGRPRRVERDRHGDGPRPVRAARPRARARRSWPSWCSRSRSRTSASPPGRRTATPRPTRASCSWTSRAPRPRVERLDPGAAAGALPRLALRRRRDLARRARRPARPRRPSRGVRAGMARLADHARAAARRPAQRRPRRLRPARSTPRSTSARRCWSSTRATWRWCTPRAPRVRARTTRAPAARSSVPCLSGGLEPVAGALRALGCEVIAPSLRSAD